LKAPEEGQTRPCRLPRQTLRQQQHGAVREALNSILYDPSYSNHHNVREVSKWERRYNIEMVGNI